MTQLQKSFDILLESIEADEVEADLKARFIEVRIGICWWGSIICAALATVGGFIAAAPEFKQVFAVEPWMISVLTASAAGLEIVRLKTNWRAKSNAFYAHRDVLNQIARRLRYETPNLSERLVASISKEYREEDRVHGERLRKINDDRDKAAFSESMQRQTDSDTGGN